MEGNKEYASNAVVELDCRKGSLTTKPVRMNGVSPERETNQTKEKR